MRLSAGIAIAAMAMISASAQAQSSTPALYGELGYTFLKYSDEGVDIKPGAIRGIFGYNISPNLAIEGMLALGIKDDTISILGTPVKAELVRAYGIYVKPKVNLTNDLELFGRIGFADSRVKLSARGLSASDSDRSASYGVGLNFKISPTVAVGVDYMSYYNKDGGKAEGFTVGVGTSF